jgi:hypothetical protein
MNEKRSLSRKPTFLKAQAISPGDRTPVDCLVCDISDGGARLQPVDGMDVTTLPERFDLLLVKTGERRPVRVAWRGESEIGVAFDPSTD